MKISKRKNSALNIIKKRKIKILLKDPSNTECFECTNLNPEYISINNGIFICKKCFGNHLEMPKSISNIIKNNLGSLTLENLEYLCYGGNQKLIDFINDEYPQLKQIPAQFLYKTYAMDFYRKWLEYLIQGGTKPVKPDLDKAYELINIPENKEPQIKLIDRHGSSKFQKISKNDDKFNLTEVNNSAIYDNDNVTNQNQNFFQSTADNFKNKLFLLKSKNQYDSDDIYEDKNNLTDINEMTEPNLEKNLNRHRKYRMKKNKNDKKRRLDTNIKVYRTNYNTQNVSFENNYLNKEYRSSVYSKPLSPNYLNYNNRRNMNQTECNSQEDLINIIDDYNKCINNKNAKNKKKYNTQILDLKHSNANTGVYNKEDKLNVNNYNNNIIINKSLNIYCNNSAFTNHLQQIFKKKTIGNSFSTKDKNRKRKVGGYSMGNDEFFVGPPPPDQQVKNKNVWKKRILDYNNIYGGEKIKVNRIQNNMNNNIRIENSYLKFDNEKVDFSQKSKIIQRISRVLKNQKERAEKKKSLENIKTKAFYKEEQAGVNNANKNKTHKKEYNTKIFVGGYKSPKIITDSNNNIYNYKNEPQLIEPKMKNNNPLSIKELINASSVKKRHILDIVKSNNLSSKLNSPNSNQTIRINKKPNKLSQDQFNFKDSIQEIYKRRKGYK